jgi:hypothetical protein
MAAERKQTQHTPGPWRLGDAGATIFGPKNGNPCPEMIASVKKRANAEFILRACNSHADLLRLCKQALEMVQDPTSAADDLSLLSFETSLEQAIVKAEGSLNVVR